MFFRQKPKPIEIIPPTIGGLRVRPGPRARRMGLRVEAKSGEVVFIWPLRSRITEDKALRFIEQNRSWIEKQKAQIVERKPFAPGTVLSIGGIPCVIQQGQGRGLTRIENSNLVVYGRPEHLSRRVRDYLKEHARDVLTRLAQEKSASLGLAPCKVRILDPRTRWGSCGPDGNIMFSWRLILAPYEVMDYVVAHEIAHRIHLNHSRKFWKLCTELAPQSLTARRWLRQNGRQLMGYV